MNNIQNSNSDMSTENGTKPPVGGSFVATTDKERFMRKEFKHMGSVFEDDFKEYEKVMSKDAKSCKTCGTYYWDGCKKRCLCQ